MRIPILYFVFEGPNGVRAFSATSICRKKKSYTYTYIYILVLSVPKEATHEQFLFKKPIQHSTLHLASLLRTPLTHHQNGFSTKLVPQQI